MTKHHGGLHVIEHPAFLGSSGAPPSGLRVVLVHGSLDRAASFARVARRIDEDVVTYDRRGYHRSRAEGGAVLEPPYQRVLDPRYAFHQHVADLLEVVGDHPSVVVGHSLGGDIALGAAAAAPGVICAVGAYEPPLPWVDWWPRRARNDILETEPGSFAEGFFQRMVSEEAWERLPERSKAQRRADGPALVAELASIRTGEPLFDASSLEMPVVLGRGESSRDHHRRSADFLHDLIPKSTIFEIPDAGHGAHASRPDQFAAFVEYAVRQARVSRG